MGGSGRWRVSAWALWAEMVARSDPLLEEHGGGVKGVDSGSRVLLHERNTPPSALAPIAAGGRRGEHAPPRGTANRRETTAAVAPPLPIRSDTNTSGHARFRTPPNRGRHKQRARPGLQVTGPQCEAQGRDELLSSRERPGDGAVCRQARARPRAAAQPMGGDGRRATLASALELEGTVLREGRLTQFVANNLERRIRLSGAPRGEAAAAGPIPAIDPGALQDVVALAGQVAAQVDELLRNVHCGLQALTALSVGCIQTYRDGVESLGEAADLSIRAMYALVARCEELDRAMQPVPALAKRIRDMKGTLERLEGLCK
nr:BLOC-1-related complex subunit 6 [Dromaius novaehollandiae]